MKKSVISRNQLNLNDEQAAPPYEDICCESCWYAKGEKCQCRCGGAHHGKGIQKDQEESPLKKYYPSAQKYMKYLKNPICGSNARHIQNVDLRGEIIWAYPHTEGYKIEESDEKQWLYIRCPVCAHDWALWKLGIQEPEQ